MPSSCRRTASLSGGSEDSEYSDDSERFALPTAGVGPDGTAQCRTDGSYSVPRCESCADVQLLSSQCGEATACAVGQYRDAEGRCLEAKVCSSSNVSDHKLWAAAGIGIVIGAHSFKRVQFARSLLATARPCANTLTLAWRYLFAVGFLAGAILSCCAMKAQATNHKRSAARKAEVTENLNL